MIVDTPGEYIENRNYYSALLVSAAKVDIVAFVQDASQKKTVFPPGFGMRFNKPVIGIVTKTDLEEKDIKRSLIYLKKAGARDFYLTSALEKKGIQSLFLSLVHNRADNSELTK